MVQQDSSGHQLDTGNEHSKPAEVAGTAAEEASTQVKVVAGQARQQFDDLVIQTRDEVRSQAESRNVQAAQGLRTLSQEVSALAEGRPDDAGPLLGLLEDAQRSVNGLAERLEGGGTQGVIDDVTRFARRRPGLFLAGAIGAGFLVGRLVRAGTAKNQDDDQADLQGQQYGDPISPMGNDQFPTTDPLFVDGAATLPPPAGTTILDPPVLPLADDPIRDTLA
jgi:hypothetical protein